MSFLNPFFLTAMAALTVPVVLHLMRRRQGRTFDFPAVRYLRRTTREHARIIRLRQLALLALRMTAVALLVLAGARLILPFGGRDDPPAGLVLVVDNGISSGATLGDGRVLDTLVARAHEALARTGARDRVWVVPAGEPWRPSVPVAPAEARETVTALEPTHVTPDLPAQIRRAGRLLEPSGMELREVVVLSDFRPGALKEVDPETERRVQSLHLAPPPLAAAANRGVEILQISGGLTPVAGDPGELYVRVGGPDGGEAVVRAYLEDQLVDAGRTGADGTTTLSFPPLAEGWRIGRVELDPDDLRGDDVGFFAFPVRPPPDVHLGTDGLPFLGDAIATLEDAGRVRSVPAEEADVHLVSTQLPVEPDSGSIVAILPPDDEALLPAVNRLLEGLLPGWRIEPEPGATGTERRIAGGTALPVLPEQPAVRRAHRIQVSDGAPSPTELLTLSDGSPWLLEASSRGRTVLVLASPLDQEASDVPLSAAMVPLVELLTSSRGPGAGSVGTPAGHPLRVPADAASVRGPDGTLYPLDGRSFFSRTGHAGIYRFLADDGETLEFAAVNALPPDTPPLSTAEATRRLSRGWSDVREPTEWATSVLESRQGREVWRWLVVALLTVLLFEAWLATSAPRKPRSSGTVEGTADRAQRMPRTLES